MQTRTTRNDCKTKRIVYATAAAPCRLRATLATRLLFKYTQRRRGSRGNPSRRTMALSDRSIESNWFCFPFGLCLVFQGELFEGVVFARATRS